MCREFGYVRVSSRDQNEDRQLIAMLDVKVPETVMKFVAICGHIAGLVLRVTGKTEPAEAVRNMTKDVNAVRHLMKPFAMIMKVIANENGTRNTLRQYLGDVVKESTEKARQCVGHARDKVARGVMKIGAQAVRGVAKGVLFFKKAAGSVSGCARRALSWFGL